MGQIVEEARPVDELVISTRLDDPASLDLVYAGGASGHETDKVSPNSPKKVHVFAKGLDIDDGGAVFSASSICYVSSLPVDDGVSKVTANVLRKFLG